MVVGILDLKLRGNRVPTRKSDKACLAVVAKTESVAQTRKTKDSKTKWRPSLILNQEFRHFTLSATFKQNFFTRETCPHGDKFFQATETESRENIFEFGKELRSLDKNPPTHFQTLEFSGIPHLLKTWQHIKNFPIRKCFFPFQNFIHPNVFP